ncbi:carboxypeptidase-like regulatory domain-containing protein, partial [Metabacillus fastidiosus]|uniref:carboxypeptidase-like regulatory domain-containing protein n=1 Tax=Metabacillus fastidiosus TaxID=1458 RepID=UPI002E22DBC0|nr:carboxypeptidase-like regulatory domain-containing protein [Metabacillus fastidiosus]
TTIPVRSTLTDSNGNYGLTGLNEGEYRIEISADNYASFISRIVLAPGESRTLDASLAPNPATIQGRLVDVQTGEPIAGAAVITVLSNSGIIVASTQTDQNGQYVLTGLAPGTYNVVFSADNFAGQTSTVTLTAGETETVNASLTPNPAAITGTVADAFTGNPIANALIQVFNSQGILINSTLSDNNGQFTVSGLPEGTLTVQASANNFASQVQSVTLTPGETKGISFTLTPDPASLNGTVTETQNGNPIAGALVQTFLVGTT